MALPKPTVIYPRGSETVVDVVDAHIDGAKRVIGGLTQLDGIFALFGDPNEEDWDEYEPEDDESEDE